jgi:hypothetical protein
MKKSKIWTSIVESLVVMMILSLWIIWAYKVYFSSSKLAMTTENRISAIQIAKEWIEAFSNIRNTNWLLFAADYKNCWNTLNYNNTCIANTGTWTDIANNWHYIIYKNNDNRWLLWTWAITNSDYSNPSYRNEYRLYKTSSWFYTQSWWLWNTFFPIFTRELIVNYINTSWAIIDSNDEKMEITSLVQWSDASSFSWTIIHRVELKTILTNRKNKN